MMDEIGSVDEQWENEPELTVKQRRGEFLFILCVLSWASQFSTLTSSLMMIFNGEKMFQDQAIMMSELEGKSSGSEFLDGMLETSMELMDVMASNIMEISLLNMGVVLLGALGVYLMYSLKKAGFIIYLIYCFAELYVINRFFGELSTSIFMIGSTALFSVVFIVLYGVNLKRMKF